MKSKNIDVENKYEDMPLPTKGQIDAAAKEFYESDPYGLADCDPDWWKKKSDDYDESVPSGKLTP